MSIHTFDMWPSTPQCGADHRGARVIVTQDFRKLPRAAQCLDCLAMLERSYLGLQSATRDHILSVSLFCGSLAGALDSALRAAIADYIAHDRLGQADPSPLLDLAEQRGLHEGGYGPERYEEWPEATEHVHVWLLAIGEGNGGQRGPMRVGPDGPLVRQCPCGVFEHEARDNSDRGRITAIQIGETRNLVWVDPFNGI